MQNTYKQLNDRGKIKWRLGILIFICLLFFSILISIRVGAKDISFSTIVNSFLHYDKINTQHVIIQTLRMPRIIVAVAVGASFAVSGSLMQASTRNPMASPSTLGINAGAGLGLAVAMVVLPGADFNRIVIFSMAGAAVSAIIIFVLAATVKSAGSPIRLALVGTAISALFNAFSQSIATAFNIAQSLSFWNAGGIQGVRQAQVRLLIPWTVVGLILAFFIRNQVSLLSLGEDVAKGLGGRPERIRFAVSATVLILTGSAVAMAGPIGFVGLVVPHLVKFITGADYKRIIPASTLAGALLVVVADIVGRIINPPFETPTGAVTAVIGVPFFIYLATRKGSR